jgi:hypothetical protein
MGDTTLHSEFEKTPFLQGFCPKRDRLTAARLLPEKTASPPL